MLKMVVIPDWVLRAVQSNGAPLETVLDAFALSSILSPRDVAFYLASTEAVIRHIHEVASPIRPSYSSLFAAMPSLHVSAYDWIEDALNQPNLSEEAEERLHLIRHQFEDIVQQQLLAFESEDAPNYVRKLSATLWRDPTQALSGNIPEGEYLGRPDYAPQIDFVPIVIKDPETLRRTGLDKNHMDASQPASRVVVIGAVFSPPPTNESASKVFERSYANAMSTLSNFMPLHEVLNSALTDGYVGTYFYEKEKLVAHGFK